MNHHVSNVGIPKTIWIMWLQGFENAPYLVQKCLATWQKHNPDWRLVVLHQENIGDYINVDQVLERNRQTISRQAISNIFRINLLAEHGGVWVDATCYCCKPLDDWLGSRMTSGFFAFSDPGPDRLLSSWFLASAPGCQLTVACRDEVNQYWRRNVFPFQDRWSGRLAIKWIGKFLNRNSRLASLWVHPLTARSLRLHPYHWFHYIVYRVIEKDAHSREIWKQSQKISADIPHRLQHAGLLSPISTDLKAIVDGRMDPLYKLNWRYEHKNWPSDSILDYLIGSR